MKRSRAVALLAILLVPQLAQTYPAAVYSGPASAMSAPAPAGGSKDPADDSVAADGSALHRIALALPPGRQGMTPDLALTYSSRNPVRGGLAAGWSFELPHIEVDTSEGRLAGLFFKSSLSGTRLVKIAEPNGPTDAETYRAELDDSYTRYERLRNADGSTISWRARTLDGRTWYFGDVDNAKDTPTPVTPSGPVESRWFVTRVVDRFGNEIRYNYTKPPEILRDTMLATVDIAPTSIEWSANAAAGLSASSRVIFTYSADRCPGSFVPIGAAFSFRTGTPIMRGARRLNKISVEVNENGTWKQRRRYDLGYDMDELACPTGRTHAPLRLLTSVQQTATAADGTVTTLPPTTFEYGRRELELTQKVNLTARSEGRDSLSTSKAGGWPTIDSMLLDFDGDGKLDRLWSKPTQNATQCGATWQRNLGNGSFSAEQVLNLPTVPWAGSTRNDSTTNRDVREGCSLGHQFSRVATISGGTCGAAATYNSYRFMDVTGDGRPDLVTAVETNRGQYRPENDTRLTHPASCPDQGACRDSNWNPTLCKVISPVLNTPPNPTLTFQQMAAAVDDPTGPGTHGCPWDMCPSPLCKPDDDKCDCAGEYCGGSAIWPKIGSEFAAALDHSNGLGRNLDGMFWNGPGQQHGDHAGEGKVPTRGVSECTSWPEVSCGRYVWRVYPNTGTGFGAQQLILSPLPLESDRPSSALGAGMLAASSSWHGFIDMDGDGNLDAVYMTPFWGSNAGTEPWGAPDFFLVFRGDGTGNFLGNGTGAPYVWKAPIIQDGNGALRYRARIKLGTSDPAVPPYPEQDNIEARLSVTTLADVNGDGLPDYIDNRQPWDNTRRVRVYYNTGRGFETTTVGGYRGSMLETPAWGTSTLSTLELSHDYSILNNLNRSLKVGWSRAVHRWVDIDADGLQDLIVLQAPTRGTRNAWVMSPTQSRARLFVNTGDKLVPMGETSKTISWASALARITLSRSLYDDGVWSAKTDFTDLDGDGLPEAYTNDDNVAACNYDQASEGFGVACGQSIASWTSPKDGQGMRLLRRVSNGMGGETRFEYAPVASGNGRVPHPVWVVTKRTVAAGLGAIDPSPEMVSTYTYEDPVYNTDHRGDWGFRGFTKVRVTAPTGATTVTRYDYTQHWAGLPVDTRVFVGTHAESIETRTYQRHELFSGKIWAFHLNKTTRRTCGATQDEATCATNGVASYATDAWKLQRSTTPVGGSDVAWVLDSHTDSPTPLVSAGTRKTTHTYFLRSDANNWRMLPDLETRWFYPTAVAIVMVGKTQHTYDTSGRVETSTSVWRDAAQPPSVTARVFNMNTGNVSSVRRPSNEASGDVTSFTYDASATFLSLTINELNHITIDTWDAATGAQTSHRGPNYKQNVREGWEAKVDGLGRAVQKSVYIDDATLGYKPVIVERTTYYDAPTSLLGNHAGQIVERRVELAEDRWTHHETALDGMGRTVSTTEKVGSSVVALARTFYDAAGQRNRADVPAPNATGAAVSTFTFTYDALGRIKDVLRPDGTGERWTYDGVTAQREDIVGSRGGSVGRTRTHRDAWARLVEVGEQLSNGTWATTTYHYDGNGNVDEIVDADGVITNMLHDWTSKRVQITRGDRVWKYGYNADGNLTSIAIPPPIGADPTAYLTTIVYDRIGRETSRVAGSRGLTPQQLALFGAATIGHTYDEAPTDNGIGRLGHVSTPLGTTTFRYEARGLVRERQDSFSILGSTFTDTRTSRYTYNALGAVSTETFGDYPDPAQATRVSHAVDNRSLPLSSTWLNTKRNIASYATTAAGAVLSRTVAGTYSHVTNRDAVGRVIRQYITAPISTGGPFVDRVDVKYNYDGNGDVEAMQWKLAPSGVGTAESFSFGYDTRHQLVEASGPAGYTASFDYSPAGRVTAALVDASPDAVDVTRRNVTYDYNVDSDPETPDRLISVDSSTWLGLDHDAAGNTTTRQTSAGAFTHAYDGLDRQREVAAPDGHREIYWYGGDNSRAVSATLANSGEVERVRWTFGDTELWYGANHSVTKSIAHVAGAGTQVARIEDRTKLEQLFADQYGHTMMDLADSGVMLAGFVYGPFAELLRQAGNETSEVTRRFNGKEHDEVSDLSYYGARYYDTRSLTWTQPDPLYRIVPDTANADPRRMSTFAFSLNNPMRYVDPNGLDIDTGEDPDDPLGTMSDAELITNCMSNNSCIYIEDGYEGPYRVLEEAGIALDPYQKWKQARWYQLMAGIELNRLIAEQCTASPCLPPLAEENGLWLLNMWVPGEAATGSMKAIANWVAPADGSVGEAVKSAGKAFLSTPAFMLAYAWGGLIDAGHEWNKYLVQPVYGTLKDGAKAIYNAIPDHESPPPTYEHEQIEYGSMSSTGRMK